MDCTITKANESTWIIDDGGVRLFLLAGEEKALLIDSGMNLHTAKDVAESLTELPVMLLNTHADRDHIGSNEQFASFYMHPKEEAVCRRSGLTGTVLPVQEGDVIDLGKRELRIIDLPGHTPGSIAVLDVNSRVLISGDPIQAHGRIFMFGDHRNMADYISSLDHLETYREQFDWIWPSHADLPVAKDLIPRLRDGAAEILAGRAKGTEAELFGKAVAVFNLGFSTFLCNPQ